MPSIFHSSMAASTSIHSRPSFEQTVKGWGRKCIHVLDTNPLVRMATTILVIAAGIISIVGMIVLTGGQGLVLFFLIPSFLLTALGLTMLFSDVCATIKNKKLQCVAEAIISVSVPFILLGISATLITMATVASGGSALVFANPLFSLGMVASGLSMISARKITFQFFFTLSQVRKNKQKSEE